MGVGCTRGCHWLLHSSGRTRRARFPLGRLLGSTVREPRIDRAQPLARNFPISKMGSEQNKRWQKKFRFPDCSLGFVHNMSTQLQLCVKWKFRCRWKRRLSLSHWTNVWLKTHQIRTFYQLSPLISLKVPKKMNRLSGQFDPDIENIDPRRRYRCHINTSGLRLILASAQSKNSHIQANKTPFTSCLAHFAPPTLQLSLKSPIAFGVEKTYMDSKKALISLTVI